MQNNPQTQNSRPFYSFFDIDKESHYGIAEGTIHNLKIGPATRQDGSPVLNDQGQPQVVANFSVRLSNVSKAINYAMSDVNPQTQQAIPVLDEKEETIFVNVSTWDERTIKGLQSAGVKEKDRLLLTGSFKKRMKQNGQYTIDLRLRKFKVVKRSDVQASTGNVTGEQAVYGQPQVAPTPSFGATMQPAQPTMPQAAPAQPTFNQGYAQPGYGQAMPQTAPVQPAQPTFNQGFAQPGYPAQPDFSQAINVNDDDLPF